MRASSRNSVLSSAMCKTMSVPRSDFSVASIEYSGDPSQLHLTGVASSRWLHVTMSTCLATMKAE